MAVAALLSGCGGDPDEVAAVDTTATATPAKTTPPAPTGTTAPTPARQPTATPEPVVATVLVPAQPTVLGLDATAAPAGATDDQAAIRSTLLGVVDADLAFEEKVPFMENGEVLRTAHDGFMAVLVGLAGQIVLTEPTITVDGDTALMTFSAQGPSIGTINYELDMIRVGDRWLMTQEAMCQAASVSNVPCP